MSAVFHRALRALTRQQLCTGVGLGALDGGVQIGQTQSLVSTPASVSGFITGSYVVLTPVFTALLLRQRVGRRARRGAADHHRGHLYPRGPARGIALPATPGAWGSLLYTVLFASIFAIRAQTWTQAQVSATRAAVVMTLEPVFAALFAVALGARRPP